MMTNEPFIRLSKVSKSFGGMEVLRDVSCEVGRGEFVSIMGSSGSGKSTLLNLIGGMDRPDGGVVIVGGRDISALDDDALTHYRREEIGFIFQFFNLFPNLTVFENIEMPLLLKGRADEARVGELIRTVGLEGRQGAYPYQLSGGQQQRVAIARALVHNPAIILADEPTGSLDSRTGSAIMELILASVRTERRTVILVTHEQHIADYAHRTLRIRDGSIAQ